MIKARKPHNKSRNGCIECKRRHVKVLYSIIMKKSPGGDIARSGEQIVPG